MVSCGFVKIIKGFRLFKMVSDGFRWFRFLLSTLNCDSKYSEQLIRFSCWYNHVQMMKHNNKETNLLVIRQKSESQNGGNKKTKYGKFPEKRKFLTPDLRTYICILGVQKYSLFGKFGTLCFLVPCILRFALFPY